MTDEQFTAFSVLLASISLPSILLLIALVLDLWEYGTRGQR